MNRVCNCCYRCLISTGSSGCIEFWKNIFGKILVIRKVGFHVCKIQAAGYKNVISLDIFLSSRSDGINRSF